MTEKELHKLHRRELLELLLQQGREAVQLGSQLSETEDSLQEVQTGNERLKTKLDDKDAQIEKLKERLNEKDAQIGKLKSRLDEKDAKIHDLRVDVQTLTQQRRLEIGEIITALKLDGFLESIQQAADQYLLNGRHIRGEIVEEAAPLTIDAPDTIEIHTEPEFEAEAPPEEPEMPEPLPEEAGESPEASGESAEEPAEDLSEECPEEQHEQVPYEEPSQPEAASSEAPQQDESEKPAEAAEKAEPDTAEKNTINIESKHFWQRWRKSRQ